MTTDQVTEWMWDLGNNHFIGSQPNPVYTYDELGIYTVCLDIEAGQCQDDTCLVIDMSDTCLLFQPSFVYSIDQEALTVTFIDQSGGAPNQWLWGFGDTNTSNDQNPVHSYDTPGNYHVCLLVQNTETGCNASYCTIIEMGVSRARDLELRNREVEIYPNPSAPGNSA